MDLLVAIHIDSLHFPKGLVMARKNNRRQDKRKNRTAFVVRGKVSRTGGEPEMSAVVLKLAEPVLKKYGNDARAVETIISLTIAAWNKALFRADRQDDIEKDIIDTLVPPDGDAGLVGVTMHVMDLIEERRKKLFPNLRKIIVDYDLQVAEGRIALNVASTWIPAGR